MPLLFAATSVTKNVPLRLHSECLTGDSIVSLRCDCHDQLEETLSRLGKMDNGILLYLCQEGRGIGLTNKIKAYQIQDFGYDTVEANKILGFSSDKCDYAITAHMIKALEIKSIKLMTNNPKKIADLKHHGIKVAGRIPLEIMPNKYNLKYLKTKKKKSGHLLKRLTEQIDNLTTKD